MQVCHKALKAPGSIKLYLRYSHFYTYVIGNLLGDTTVMARARTDLSCTSSFNNIRENRNPSLLNGVLK